MASLEDAVRAQATLRAQIGRADWLRGLGIGLAPEGGHCVQVNVAALTAEIRAAVPEVVDGVPVQLEVVGDISV